MATEALEPLVLSKDLRAGATTANAKRDMSIAADMAITDMAKSSAMERWRDNTATAISALARRAMARRDTENATKMCFQKKGAIQF